MRGRLRTSVFNCYYRKDALMFFAETLRCEISLFGVSVFFAFLVCETITVFITE